MLSSLDIGSLFVTVVMNERMAGQLDVKPRVPAPE